MLEHGLNRKYKHKSIKKQLTEESLVKKHALHETKTLRTIVHHIRFDAVAFEALIKNKLLSRQK